MARSSCPSCRAANLPDALVCVTCGSALRAGAKAEVPAEPGGPRGSGWHSLVPEEPARARRQRRRGANVAEGRSGLAIAAFVLSFLAMVLPFLFGPSKLFLLFASLGIVLGFLGGGLRLGVGTVAIGLGVLLIAGSLFSPADRGFEATLAEPVPVPPGYGFERSALSNEVQHIYFSTLVRNDPSAERQAAEDVARYYSTELSERGWSVAAMNSGSLQATKPGSPYGLQLSALSSSDPDDPSNSVLSLHIILLDCNAAPVSCQHPSDVRNPP